MRIALIRQRYNPFGGAERFVARAADALAAEGATVTVFARDWQGGGEVRAVRCDPFHVGRVWRDWSFARAACEATARERFDLVQSHERLSCCDIYRAGDGVHRQWLENRSHALGPFARLAQALSPYHRYVLGAEARMFASPRLRAVICNSRMVRNEIRRHFGLDESRLHVIYNGADIESFHPRVKAEFRAPMRAKLGIPAEAPVLLFVGSGFERKGVARLVDALGLMPARDAHLVVVGKDKAERQCQALAHGRGLSGRAHFVGGQQDVRPWYGLADAFALPTLYDPFPNAALEALACGLPIVTSTQSGAAELVEAGVNGYVCDALDIPALARSCSDVLALSRDPASQAAARRAAEPLDIASMAKRLLALYRSLAPGSLEATLGRRNPSA